MTTKRLLIILIVALLVLGGGWGLHIQLYVVLQDLPFLVIGFIGGWYFRSRWKP